ncbi:alanine racemase [Pseudooceanicola nanhaiensis]|uniref:alanine racemase n=1 Tax=Pseudooceanicola nanhaiensis TaxID=375761 RepID=UPI001CD47FB8|nr:alanine racemase [Pseudooceanicola nanhaiensis]MCA0921010.1 alanine racemase [Pseudooceanicola nanhaiensis]
MSTGTLTIDLDALARNWRALDALSAGPVETGAVVKGNGYGMGAAQVATALARAGARKFFIATVEEGAAVRQALGDGPEICVFSGHMAGDSTMIYDLKLVPMINSIDQMLRHVEMTPGHPFGIQLDTGMNRLGMEAAEWAALREIALQQNPRLIMSHLACADEPDHPMNAHQLKNFKEMTEGLSVPRSLAATGGILLGPDYHFDVTRAGVGMYGGLPFAAAENVITLDLPVIQVREVEPGETVGYGNSWTAEAPAKIATLSAGYADGLHRAFAKGAHVFAGETPCPLRGRISMDLITAEVTHLPKVPESLTLMGPQQNTDVLADLGGTIGYELFTSLGARYKRQYLGA